MFGSVLGLWTIQPLVSGHPGSIRYGLPFIVWVSSWTSHWFIVVVLRQGLKMSWNCGDQTGLEVRVPRPWPPKCCGAKLIDVLKVLSLLILLKKHRTI